MRKKPTYPLASVDKALLLLHLLRDQGVVRVSEAADVLGIGASSAHRLLAMLVYRNFAIRDDKRRYRAGPALSLVLGNLPLTDLRGVLTPHMERARERFGESVHAAVQFGPRVRIIASLGASVPLHIIDSEGIVLPAHRSALGKALLSSMASAELESLYSDSSAEGSAFRLDEQARTRLLRELEAARWLGYAINHGEVEEGVSAVAVCLRNRLRRPVAAMSVAMPSLRFPLKDLQSITDDLLEIRSEAEKDLLEIDV